MCTEVLDQGFGFAHRAENYLDQVCLGLAAHKFGLRWRQLDLTHNFPMASFLPQFDSARAAGAGAGPALPRRDGAALLGRPASSAWAPAHPEVGDVAARARRR